MERARRTDRRLVAFVSVAWLAGAGSGAAPGQAAGGGDSCLPATQRLTDARDLAMEMVAGIDRYFVRELGESAGRRERHWRRDCSSPEAYARSVEPNRRRLAKIIGAVDVRLPTTGLHLVATTTRPARMAETGAYTVDAVRWPVFDGVDGEGLLLRPREKAVARVVALPDADQTPEQFAGIEAASNAAAGAAPPPDLAARLAAGGCEVLVPVLIDRADTGSGNPEIRMTNQPHREFIYRMAFEMGRHIIGYEVQKTLAAVDWFCSDAVGAKLPVGVIGYGEGGLIALYSAAIDPRIDAACVSGYFGPREGLWREPIYRNVWALLDEFGDAEIASLIAPRPLVIEAARGPEITGPPPARPGRTGAAVGQWTSPEPAAVRREVDRARPFYDRLNAGTKLVPVTPQDGRGGPGSREALRAFLAALTPESRPLADAPSSASGPPADASRSVPAARAGDSGSSERMRRQFTQLVEHTQRLVRESHLRRAEFWAKADASSPATWEASCRWYRDYLWDEVIGRCPPPGVPANPRTRRVCDKPNWTGYEVVLDVWPDVFAYGILLVPKDLRPGERRPVVVCQHGLEGRPRAVVDPAATNPFYHAYGAALADRGFIVYAPQNPYIGGDAFRLVQRKANPLRRSLFSVIVRQHEQTLNWLATLPFVDPGRIAFYGLSYGGKTAMRVPALLPRYCLSICSGDFNEWIVKTTSIDLAGTYMFTHEWEIHEFDMGNTFNYAELAWLIFPRPFMVERGHHDPVGTDEMVSWEYARVRRFYADMNLADRTTIEYFQGRHEIHGAGTFEFLRKHLDWK